MIVTHLEEKGDLFQAGPTDNSRTRDNIDYDDYIDNGDSIDTNCRQLQQPSC
jgi:hypothetical protein